MVNETILSVIANQREQMPSGEQRTSTEQQYPASEMQRWYQVCTLLLRQTLQYVYLCIHLSYALYPSNRALRMSFKAV